MSTLLRLRRLWPWGVAVCVTACALVWILLPRSSPHGDPDPGGRTLTLVSTIQMAVPSGSFVVLSQSSEPYWDSCDGAAGTFGWGNVEAHFSFRTSMSLSELLTDVDANLQAVGWAPTGAASWERLVPSGTASASLTREGGPNSTRWDLDATAPPIGPRASGC